MKTFCYTVDDNIRFFQQLTERQSVSIFEHPYLAMYQRLHETYDLKIQLNLFYENADFNLSLFPDRYKHQWEENASWLKLSFHSRLENVCPYENSGYDEVSADCGAVHNQILRFAGKNTLADTTTVHYCLNTPEGLAALRDRGIKGLLGLFGSPETPRTSYSIPLSETDPIRAGKTVTRDGITFAAIDVILNLYSTEEILERLREYTNRDQIRIMIHEQYFYPDYPAYQPDFEAKLNAAFDFLTRHGYQSALFEEMI